MFERFVRSVRAEMSAAEIVGIAVGIMLAGFFVPMSLQPLIAANYTGVDVAVKSVLTTVFPVMAIVGIALALVGKRHHR